MTVESAPYDPNAEERECPICEHEGDYVLYDNDSVCEHCGHVHGGDEPQDEDLTEWSRWRRHRRNHDDYKGWLGEDRIKMVGGFAAAYEYGALFE